MTAHTIAPKPALTIRLYAYAYDLRVTLGYEMRSAQTSLGGQSRRALKQQRLMLREPFRAHEKIGERGMCLVSARVSERHLKCRNQLDVEPAVSEILQFSLTKFNVVFRAHPDRCVRPNIVPRRLEADAIRVIDRRVSGG